MIAYGRQPPHAEIENAEAHEDELEKFEEGEPEEHNVEDVEEPGARERREPGVEVPGRVPVEKERIERMAPTPAKFK
jgi:hypothetical protein